MVEGAGFRPALGGGRGHRLYYLKSVALDRTTEPWSALLDAGREDGRLVREAREGPGARARSSSPRRSCTPTCSRRSRALGVERLYSHQAQALARGLGGPDDRHHRHRVGQVAVLQPAHARRALPRRARAGALPLPDQGARPGPGARAGGVRPDQARAPGDLRRRHAARGARADPQERERRADQPRHAARRHPAQPRRLGGAVREPGGRGDRRGARVPRRVRLARRQRAAPAAADRRRVRHRAALPAHLGDDRQPARARRAPDGPRGRAADRRGRLARAAAADRGVEPAADRRGARHAPLGAGRGGGAAGAARARRRARDLLHEVAQGRRGAQPARQAATSQRRPPRAGRARRALPRRLHRRSSGASSRGGSCAASCAR